MRVKLQVVYSLNCRDRLLAQFRKKHDGAAASAEFAKR